MGSDIISLTVENRDIIGKKVNSLRRDGMVPANIYERGQASVAVVAPLKDLTKVFHEAGKHHPVEVSIGSGKKLAMIKDVDVHPVTGVIRHVAFHAVNQNETVEAEVPVVVPDDNPAHKVGLLVIQTTDALLVKALPRDIPDELVADVSKLQAAGDHITVADLAIPHNIELVDIEMDHTIATVEEPKDQIAAAAAEAEASEAQDESAVPSDNGSDETPADNA